MFSYSFGQQLKINQSEQYFQNYRYEDAFKIYKELIVKNKIPVSPNIEVFRHAVIAAEKNKDFLFAYETLLAITTVNETTPSDYYNLFLMSLKTGNYHTAKEVLSSSIVNSMSDSERKIISAYKKGELWEDLKKDSSKYKISTVDFNSGKGDFNPIYHPKGIAFSSARSNEAREWASDGSSFLNLYVYNKQANKVEEIDELSGKKHDGSGYYDSINGLWYYSKNFTKNKNQLNVTGIFIYDEKTQTEEAFPYNSEKYFLGQPFLSQDGKTLFFSSDKSNGGFGKADIWYSFKKDDVWGEPINAGSIINTSENEMFPSFYNGQLYFSSNGHPGLGGLDIFTSKMVNNSFTSISNLGANLNSNADDLTLILDKSGKNGFFATDRNGFVDHIYSVIIKDLNFVYIAKLNTGLDAKSTSEIPVLVKSNGNVVDTLYADANGEIIFNGDKEQDYSFEINNDKFIPNTTLYSTKGKTESDTTRANIDLVSKYVVVNTVVLDEKTQKPLANAKVEIRNVETGKIETFTTDNDGKLSIELLRNANYEVVTAKDGFNQNIAKLNTSTKEKELNQTIQLSEGKETVKTPVYASGTKIKVEHILFDFAKSTLRPESKKGLDELAKFLKDNPTLNIELSAHTDSRGNAEVNLNLSQARAEVCVNYLISKGIEKSRMVAKGYGESALLNKCSDGINCSEKEHQVNRRTEIKIL